MAESQSTIAFVDLVGFTSLTDIHGDMAGADAATALASITTNVLDEKVRLVKTAGDGVLLVANEPTAGLRCAAEIIERLHDLDLSLDARGGVAHGPVINRDNDVFGSTVNLASRLAALADRGTLALTRAVALAANETEFVVTPRGHVEVRGLTEPVELFQIDPCHHEDGWLMDPVCGMRLKIALTIAASVPDNPQIGFCSTRCAEIFSASPGRYLD